MPAHTDPEGLHYVLPDTGCSLAPACLSCPFPRCRYDVGRTGADTMKAKAAQRAEQARAMRSNGATVADIADALGVGAWTVRRLLSTR